MAETKEMKVVYSEGVARVHLAGRKLDIRRSDQDLRKDFCPVELISAALGS